MNQRVARRYAEALIGVGVEKNNLDELSRDMQAIETTLLESRELRNLLNSPVVRPDAKTKVLHEVFAGKIGNDSMLFIELLVKKGRADVIGDTVAEFRALVDTKRNIVHATIKSAVALSKTEEETITAKLEKMTGKTVVSKFTVDPSVRGGFVARIGDTMIDASLSHQLELLREQFKNGGSAVLN
jgi:F-type H+-transporting ATPase subunit delta